MADLVPFIPHTKLLASALNAAITELASRIAAVVTTSTAASASAAIADADAQAAAASATAAHGSATVASTAAAAAQTTATSAVTAAAQAEADATAAAAAAATAQARADAAYALASAGASAPARPALSAGTQINVDSASRLVDHAGGALTLYPAAVANQENERGVCWPLPPTPWTATARVRGNVPQANSFSYGMMLSSSQSSKLLVIGPEYNNVVQMSVTQFSSAQGSPGSYDNYVGRYTQPWVFFGEVYVRVFDDGTTRTYQHSRDGVDWLTHLTEASGAFMTPDHAGFGCRTNAVGGSAPSGGTVSLVSLVLASGIPTN